MIAQMILYFIGGWFLLGLLNMVAMMFTKSWRHDGVESQIQRCNGAVMFGPLGFYWLIKYLITGKSSYDK